MLMFVALGANSHALLPCIMYCSTVCLVAGRTIHIYRCPSVTTFTDQTCSQNIQARVHTAYTASSWCLLRSVLRMAKWCDNLWPHPPFLQIIRSSFLSHSSALAEHTYLTHHAARDY
ncbi:hypothetical protein F4679DRAFT_558908 [Xylaria curta]|nr:hypothetical protein F4679DRAFT_558908 [Xylaria curta]